MFRYAVARTASASGFKLLEDRILYEGERPSIYDSPEAAQRSIGDGEGFEIVPILTIEVPGVSPKEAEVLLTQINKTLADQIRKIRRQVIQGDHVEDYLGRVLYVASVYEEVDGTNSYELRTIPDEDHVTERVWREAPRQGHRENSLIS